jgi:hypothetical protein
MTDIPFTSINVIAAVLDDAIVFEASLTTTTAATSLDCTPEAVIAATTTPATTTAATTTADATYTPSSDISTIACDISPVTLSLETLSHLSREFFTNRPVGSLQEAVEIAAWELAAQNQPNFMLKVCDLCGQIPDAVNAQVAWLSNVPKRIHDLKKLKFKQ